MKYILFLIILLLTGCSTALNQGQNSLLINEQPAIIGESSIVEQSSSKEKNTDSRNKQELDPNKSNVEDINDVEGNKNIELDLDIIDKPVLLTEHRKELQREYSKMHYSEEIDTIIPKAIVIHWTATDNLQSVYNYFYPEETTGDYRSNGKLNLTSHYLVDKDGSTYQLTPDTNLNRHAIGLNWCSIGIENVGGVSGNQDLTDAQLEANTKLVKYLKDKYPTIQYLLGHYQQDHSREIGLWKENVKGYYTGKPDPGPIFMEKLINNLKDIELKTFEP